MAPEVREPSASLQDPKKARVQPYPDSHFQSINMSLIIVSPNLPDKLTDPRTDGGGEDASGPLTASRLMDFGDAHNDSSARACSGHFTPYPCPPDTLYIFRGSTRSTGTRHAIFGANTLPSSAFPFSSTTSTRYRHVQGHHARFLDRPSVDRLGRGCSSSGWPECAATRALRTLECRVLWALP